MFNTVASFLTQDEVNSILAIYNDPQWAGDISVRNEITDDGSEILNTKRLPLLATEARHLIYGIVKPKVQDICVSVADEMNGMICTAALPFSPHTDTEEGPTDSVTILIPLEMTPSDAQAHTVLFHQKNVADKEPLRVTMPALKKFKNRSERQRQMDQFIMEKAGRAMWVPYDELDAYVDNLQSTPPDLTYCGHPMNSEQWERLSIEHIYPWTPGDAFIFPSRQLHSSARFDIGNPHLQTKTWLLLKPGDILS